MAIARMKVSIKGIRPLMFHVFHEDSISLDNGRKERTGVAGNDPEEWKKTYTCTKDRQLYVDPAYVFGCLRDGAKYSKIGRGTAQSKVAATLQIVDERILFNRFIPEESEITRDSDQPVYLDVRSVRNPSTKSRNVRYRVAASSGWETSFIILFERTIVLPSVMETVINDAGMLSGIGDGRSIGYGRFELVSFVNADA